MSAVISVENVSKQYRLGEVGGGTLAHDLNRWWHKVRGMEDPYLRIGESNDRSKKGGSEYSWALRDVSFEVKQGEVLGIIGRNGAGKSTLLKILSRVTTPTTGEIKIKGRIASLLEVGTGFHPELSGRENIFLNGAILGMRKAEIAAKFDGIVDFSGCERYIDTPVKRYSSGMYVRLAFAVAAHLEPEILIVDEVLAVGDAEFQKKCLGKMKDVAGEGRTVLFVSHNMAAVQSLCGRAIMLKNGLNEDQGASNEVVERYLNSYEAQSAVWEAPPKPDAKIPQVVKIALVDDKGLLVSSISTYSNLCLRIDIFSPDALSGIDIGIGLDEKKSKLKVFGVGTDDSKSTFTIDRGKSQILFTMPKVLLNPKPYLITIALFYNRTLIQEIESAITFNVIPCEGQIGSHFGARNYGVLAAEHHWTLESKDK
ncbi:lipopolysaccharide transport system ATP-binding protein [Prosthecobacter fusiformis]|uniref:Lipopolysaccharide transport system ATP-binding protein n=1 Tax=Prosthecobacter fusiformis TaxID=48464 RepID=A0A4R7S1T6_9BACT|nr:ABC transporter ATP-binding protein [Prosthecobacter fusiformis]TDU71388.1 lipopolysaccharide transport system ATP-binding protein [Prosthecobacter fusiformis]